MRHPAWWLLGILPLALFVARCGGTTPDDGAGGDADADSDADADADADGDGDADADADADADGDADGDGDADADSDADADADADADGDGDADADGDGDGDADLCTVDALGCGLGPRDDLGIECAEIGPCADDADCQIVQADPCCSLAAIAVLASEARAVAARFETCPEEQPICPRCAIRQGEALCQAGVCTIVLPE